MKNNQPNNEIIIYQTEAKEVKIDVRLEDDTVWLTQAQLVDLYQSSKANVSEHIKNIFSDGELDEKVVVRKFRTTTKHGAIEGKTQTIDKAELEYKKYQTQTLSAVEMAYLETIKAVQKKVEKKMKKSKPKSKK